MSILVYLIIGTVVTFVLEVSIRSGEKETGEVKTQFRHIERLFMIIIWPPLLLSFIYYFLKSLK